MFLSMVGREAAPLHDALDLGEALQLALMAAHVQAVLQAHEAAMVAHEYAVHLIMPQQFLHPTKLVTTVKQHRHLEACQVSSRSSPLDRGPACCALATSTAAPKQTASMQHTGQLKRKGQSSTQGCAGGGLSWSVEIARRRHRLLQQCCAISGLPTPTAALCQVCARIYVGAASTPLCPLQLTRLTSSAAMPISSNRSVLSFCFFCVCLLRGDMKPLPTVGMPPFSAAL